MQLASSISAIAKDCGSATGSATWRSGGTCHGVAAVYGLGEGADGSRCCSGARCGRALHHGEVENVSAKGSETGTWGHGRSVDAVGDGENAIENANAGSGSGGEGRTALL